MTLLEKPSQDQPESNCIDFLGARASLKQAIDNRGIGQAELERRIINFLNGFQEHYMYGPARYEYFGSESQLVRVELDEISFGAVKRYIPPTIEDLQQCLNDYTADLTGTQLLSDGYSPVPRAVSMVFLDEIEKML